MRVGGWLLRFEMTCIGRLGELALLFHDVGWGMAFATCFMRLLFPAFSISIPMIFPFSSSSRWMSGSASIISWLGPSLKSM